MGPAPELSEHGRTALDGQERHVPQAQQLCPGTSAVLGAGVAETERGGDRVFQDHGGSVVATEKGQSPEVGESE